MVIDFEMTILETRAELESTPYGDISTPQKLAALALSRGEFCPGYQSDGWPDTSVVGMRFLVSKGKRGQDKLLRTFSDGGDGFNTALSAKLRSDNDTPGSAVHMTWRLLRQLNNYVKNDTLYTPFVAEIPGLNSDFLPWALVESAYRAGIAPVLLHKPLPDTQGIQIPRPEANSRNAETEMEIGNFVVQNSVLYTPDHQLAHSTYSFIRQAS